VATLTTLKLPFSHCILRPMAKFGTNRRWAMEVVMGNGFAAKAVRRPHGAERSRSQF
jgi:hypothetical protein